MIQVKVRHYTLAAPYMVNDALFERSMAVCSLPSRRATQHHINGDTVTANFHDFGAIGAACMQMVAKGQGISLDKAKAEKAMAAMKTLPVHPDVPNGLKKMKEAGFHLYTLGPDIELAGRDMIAVADQLLAMPK